MEVMIGVGIFLKQRTEKPSARLKYQWAYTLEGYIVKLRALVELGVDDQYSPSDPELSSVVPRLLRKPANGKRKSFLKF
jgi:hypothetical protein